MSAEAWESETDARELLRLLPENFSRRKLRHFVCECVRCRLSHPPTAEAVGVFALAERIADDEANVDADDWICTQQELHEQRKSDSTGNTFLLLLTLGEDVYEEAHWVVFELTEAENEQAIALFRDIFDNPFRPIDFAPWRTDTAVSLARQMYDSREFGAMPILADALQDAGCDNDDVLSHCRDARQTHVRGCWVVDGVLGKE